MSLENFKYKMKENLSQLILSSNCGRCESFLSISRCDSIYSL